MKVTIYTWGENTLFIGIVIGISFIENLVLTIGVGDNTLISF